MTRKLRCRFLALARCGGLAALLVACHLLAVIPLSAQVSAPYIRSGASNPAKCSAGVGLGELKLFYNVSDKKFVFCSDTDTWSGFAGLGANTFTDTQTMPGVILNGTGPFLLRGSEGTCGGATAGLDVLCLGDATGHGAMVSNNNDAFSRILRQADRFGSSPGALVATTDAGADPTTDNCVKWVAGGKLGNAGAACGGADTSVALVQYVLGNTTAVAFPNAAVTYCGVNIVNFAWGDCATNPQKNMFMNLLSGTVATANVQWQAGTLAANDATTTLTMSLYDATAAAELFNWGTFIPKAANCTTGGVTLLCSISASPAVAITGGHELQIRVTVSAAWNGTGTPIPTGDMVTVTMKITGAS